MAKHGVTPILPSVIDDERFSNNGQVPSAPLMRRLAQGFNFVASRCKKQVFLKCQMLYSVAAGEPANIVWPGYFRTGENTTGLRIAAGIALTDYGFASAPEFTLVVSDTSPAIVLSPSWYFSATSSTGTDVAPYEIRHVSQVIGTGLTPNTEYKFHCELINGARLVYLSLTEADSQFANDSATAVCNPAAFVHEGDIYDAHVADLIEANNELWQHNGAHLISWCCNYDESDAPVTDQTTYTNVLDQSSTTVTASSPGWCLFTQYHNTVNRTTVPVKFAIRTDRTLGAGTLDVRLTDGTNTISITGIGDLGGDWSTTTANIPAQAGTKWDLWAKVSAGGTEFEISGMSLFEYES